MNVESSPLFKVRFRPNVSLGYNQKDEPPWVNLNENTIDKVMEVLKTVMLSTTNPSLQVIIDRSIPQTPEA